MKSIFLSCLAVPALVAQVPALPGASVDYEALKKEIDSLHWAVSKIVQEQNLTKATVGPTLEKALVPLRARQLNAKGEALEALKVAEMLATTPFVRDIPLRTRVLTEVPPSSPAWKLASYGVLDFFPKICDGDLSVRYAKELERQGVPEVRIALQELKIEKCVQKEDFAQAKSLLAKMQTEFPQESAVREIAKKLAEAEATNAVTAVGAQAPTFSVQDLDDSKRTLTLATFKGKYLMLDFWATWCKWCVIELPETHAAYAKYKDKGFEILSISADESADDVRKFRKKPETPMPWKNVWCGKDGAMNSDYKVDGWPTLLLLGPDGKILAKGDALRGKELEKTLAKYLSNK